MRVSLFRDIIVVENESNPQIENPFRYYEFTSQ